MKPKVKELQVEMDIASVLFLFFSGRFNALLFKIDTKCKGDLNHTNYKVTLKDIQIHTSVLKH